MSVEGYDYTACIAASLNFSASTIHLVMELTYFGGLISGFIKQVEELGNQHQTCNIEDVFKECTHLLARFKGLKKGFEPLLFILFSTNILTLTIYSYYAILGITAGKVMFIVIIMHIIGTVVPISQLTYAALLADDGFTALKDMTSALR